MPRKAFKSLDEQLAILKSRGLAIPDEAAARQFLYQNNYYRVSGYSLTLRKQDVFSKNATFQNIVDIYTFDHRLRHILLQYMEIIEVTVKSVYAYEFTRVHGPTGYLEADNFTDRARHAAILAKAETQKARRLPHEAYLKHFVEGLQQEVPLWAYVDLLTISDISFLYSISEPAIQTAVAEALGITRRGGDLLGRFMHSMTIIRNLCAHGSRLYNRLFEQKPNLSKQERAFLRKDAAGTVDNAHLFGFLLVMRRLLSAEDFHSLAMEILTLTKQIPFVEMKYYGFPENWQNCLGCAGESGIY